MISDYLFKSHHNCNVSLKLKAMMFITSKRPLSASWSIKCAPLISNDTQFPVSLGLFLCWSIVVCKHNMYGKVMLVKEATYNDRNVHWQTVHCGYNYNPHIKLKSYELFFVIKCFRKNYIIFNIIVFGKSFNML